MSTSSSQSKSYALICAAAADLHLAHASSEGQITLCKPYSQKGLYTKVLAETKIEQFLSGALQITLKDVYHSPVGSRDGTGEKKGRLWYGSEPVLDQWFKHLVEETDSKDSGVVDMSEIMDVTMPVEK